MHCSKQILGHHKSQRVIENWLILNTTEWKSKVASLIPCATKNKPMCLKRNIFRISTIFFRVSTINRFFQDSRTETRDDQFAGEAVRYRWSWWCFIRESPLHFPPGPDHSPGNCRLPHLKYTLIPLKLVPTVHQAAPSWKNLIDGLVFVS